MDETATPAEQEHDTDATDAALPVDEALATDEPIPPDELTNGTLARIFHDIGDILEVQGEIRFKTVAYHRAADAIARSPIDLVAAYRAGKPPKIPGVGQAISDKIAELVDDRPDGATTTGSAPRSRPASSTCCASRASGPKTVRLIYEELGIEIDRGPSPGRRGRHAADAQGHVRRRPRRLILAGIAALETRPERIAAQPGGGGHRGRSSPRSRTRRASARIEPAGSFRRRRETIGDLDLLAETDDAAAADRARSRPSGIVDPVVNRGGYKAAVRLLRGPQVDLMVMPPGEAGHVPGSTSRGRRNTTSGSGRWPATAAGACPRRASCGSARTASR